MPLDAQAQGLLEMIAQLGGPALNEMEPADARVAAEGFVELAGTPEPVAQVQDRVIPGPAGDIPVRLYTPEGAGPFPILVYFHGGGWVIGSLETVDAACRSLANRAGCLVVSVDYRLAPEHKFPAAAEDCYAATKWAVDNAASLNADASRVAVGGDSAGGNLSAVVTLMARDRGGPPLVHQLLIYPVTNHSYKTPSYAQNADGYLLTRSMMVWFWDHYLREAKDGESPYASPMRVDNLAGLPSAHVITAEFDPLRDEGEAYAEKLRRYGVPVKHSRYDGTIHAFFTLAGALPLGLQAQEEAASELRAAFARGEAANSA